MSILSKPYFHDEEKAFEYLESVVWADGKACPHCGGLDRITKVKANPEKRIRLGLWRCGNCKRQFTVKVGTVFEHARLPLHKALQAAYLLTSSKKGISAHQLHRVLEITYKSAWFLAHRIREAMRSDDLSPMTGVVEVDETYIGNKQQQGNYRGGYQHKMKVVSLVQRGGSARSVHVERVNVETVLPIVKANIDREAHVITDSYGVYKPLPEHFAKHGVIRHEFGVYGMGEIHTNTVEGYFSIFKRGMRGIYQHCREKHLHRYLAEFDFRYSNRAALGMNDTDRATAALRGIVGKRLTYGSTH
jgi:transposase-like protein